MAGRTKVIYPRIQFWIFSPLPVFASFWKFFHPHP